MQRLLSLLHHAKSAHLSTHCAVGDWTLCYVRDPVWSHNLSPCQLVFTILVLRTGLGEAHQHGGYLWTRTACSILAVLAYPSCLPSFLDPQEAVDGVFQEKQPNYNSTFTTDGGTEVVEGRGGEVRGQAAEGAGDIVEKATPDKVRGVEVWVAFSRVLG